ncbi:GntR family transcriptional regulator [Desulfitobacterium sp. AusDCA]|uniref:GntR family transcriptional regulator n=1 Tax=Desulfitobacterium sp. AusDCA TaxID=3240383 RepID=UPI003DA6E0DE
MYSKANLSEIVVSYVKNKILTGELKSGDRLVETDISEELEISRAPIREALRELNMRGILSFSPKKGSQILNLDYKDIEEIFSIRIPLEMQVLTLIFEKSLLQEQDLNYLETLNHEMIRADNEIAIDLREKNYIFNTCDLAFHSFFWKKSKSFRRAEILENQYFQLLTAMNRDISALGSVMEKYDEHKKIIDACRTGLLDHVLAAFQAHMDLYLKAIIRFED